MQFRSWYYMHNFVRDQFINSDGFLLQASCAFVDPDALWTRIMASFGFAFDDCIEVLQTSALWFFTDQSETAPGLPMTVRETSVDRITGGVMLMMTGAWASRSGMA